MAVLGKRKAREPKVSEEEANEIFRRHFEARFKPIEEPTPERSAAPAQAASEDEDDDDSAGDEDSDESEWGGFSDDEVSEEEQGTNAYSI